MADNLKKKGLDAKRISLTQKHEVDYLKKKAKELIKACDIDMKYDIERSKTTVSFATGTGFPDRFSTSTIRRIAKALLLALDKLKK